MTSFIPNVGEVFVVHTDALDATVIPSPHLAWQLLEGGCGTCNGRLDRWGRCYVCRLHWIVEGVPFDIPEVEGTGINWHITVCEGPPCAHYPYDPETGD